MKMHDNWRGAVERVRRTQTARGRAQSGRFSIEGVRLHERALRAGWRVETAVLSRSMARDPAPRVQSLLHDLEQSGTDLILVPDDVMAELTDGRDLGAIIGLLQTPTSPTLSDVLAPGESPLLLVAADVKDPGNTGALMRTALASGATAFAACGICDPYHPKALRTSMGSLFKLPVLIVDSALELMSELSASGLQSVGLAVEGDVSLPLADFSQGGIAVVIGSETWGLAPELQEALDYLVAIPMRAGVDSYSVNAAAAIALYEIGRQRKGERD